MSYIDYLPPKKPLKNPEPAGRSSFVWPSAFSFSLHSLLILFMLAIGNIQSQPADNPGAGVIWIRSAALQQQEALAASKPESLQDTEAQDEPEGEEYVPTSSPTDPPPAAMEPALTMLYPADRPVAEREKETAAKKGGVTPTVSARDFFGQISSVAQPAKTQPMLRTEVKHPPQAVTQAESKRSPIPKPTNNMANSRILAPEPVVPPPPIKKARSTQPADLPLPSAIAAQPAKEKAQNSKPAATAKTSSGLTRTSLPVAATASVTETADRGRAVTGRQMAQLFPVPAKPAEQTRDLSKSALHLPIRKSQPAMQQPTGVFDAPVKGDLHLEITVREFSGNDLKMAVFYRQYPKNKHQRPMSAAEAKRVKTLTPSMAKVREKTFQFALQTAPDGIYEFRLVQGDGTVMEGSCLVTIMTGDKRKIVKNLGSRKLSNGPVVKILMPEGLIWEDETAFTGSMEDSESITRYNSDTGLAWKEYRTSGN
ncbi:hypothetical protein [Geotalea sp. SG265]|uniref:hypothetical protein n=1 Tax=Geotalea sp. SG265 TaxID=2922867 RepID=UPI001FAF79F4|nr:hypothetical protein [Geotalea sp. SG265]